jgi:hypothetical protein
MPHLISASSRALSGLVCVMTSPSTRSRRRGADHGTGWLDEIVAGDPRKPGNKRTAMTYAVAFLSLARVILPGYDFLAAYRSRELFRWVREQHRPDLFARLEQAGAELGMQAPHVHDAVKAITRIVLHTGRDIDQLTGEDI